MFGITNKLFFKKLYYSQIQRLKNQLYISASTNNISEQNVLSKHSLINNKSELYKYLYFKIKLSGPISVANYMKQVLTHPTNGYYMNKDVFGEKGDYITSPEISQLFGEMISVWIINEYKKIHNKPFQLVELGPGRGTLIKDILRIFHQFGMCDQLSLHLIEVSPFLSEIQEKNLCLSNVQKNDPSSLGKHYKTGVTADNVKVFWYKSIFDIPKGFSIFIAHEFFDVLPIQKFQKTKDGWFEILVDIDETDKNNEKFRFILSKTLSCDRIRTKNEQRDHIEFSLEAMLIIQNISSVITENGGFALIIDYGHNGDKTDTFRAFRQHQQCDPLLKPGTADLTADVDFAFLKQAALESNKVLCFGPVNQNDFLKELCIDIRLLNLFKNSSIEQKKQLELGYNKIMDPKGMGTCFKVVSMFPYVLKDYFEKFPVHGFQSYVTKK
ncbi:PREDICTED: NADH dehydrogenase [ubiquinone] complex I, assembly factor 7 [Ceratosolen solmsi marchali]|uniref:Protein arginine methyltransferase NDUFAF7 n=1 Tax=Ceratosolen solmsi marchali TaxID=326594 RepID=A0AAJ7DYS0_9HYME|nr:PREDICTED: NADH dehydrogenase [ubiquinone] complex I, assembly factor 7 [Ceratosolen solmsi marchali]